MQDRSPPAANLTATATLIEREMPLATLTQWVNDLRRPLANGRCVLVHGEAGVGKTSLLRAACAAARADAPNTAATGMQPPATWLWGLCEPLLSPTPLGPLLDMQDELPPALSQMLRNGRPAHEVMAELLACLKRLSRPLVLVIDDVQWADHASLDLLRYLGRRLDGLRLLLVLSYRDDELPPDHPLLGVISGLPPAATLRLALQPLSESGVEQAARMAGRQALGLHRLTQGNPFFLTELLAAPAQTFPASVRDAVLARAQRLGPVARQLLDLLSVSPLPLESEVLTQIMNDSTGAIDHALAQCLAAGLLQASADGVGFRHELARRSMESALAMTQRRELHRRILLALPRASATRRVHHADGAGLTDEVLRLAPLAAADAARASAHRQAAALYELALRRCGPRTPAVLRAELLLAYAEQSERIAALGPARDAIDEAIALYRELADPRGQGLALTRLARLQWLLGDVGAGKLAAGAAIAALEALGQPAGLAMAYAVMAQLHLLDDTETAAQDWGQRALALANQLGDTEAQVHALNTVGAAEMASADSPKAWARMQRSLDMALAHGWADHVARAYSNLVIHALVHRKVADWTRLCDEALAYCQARDFDLYALRLRVRRAHGLIECGHWASAERELREVQVYAGAAEMDRQQAAHLLALIGLRRGGAAARAERSYWLDLLAGRRQLHPSPWFAPVAIACAEAAWLLDQPETLLTLVNQAWPQALGIGEPWRCGQLAVWLRRLGQLQQSPKLALAAPCRAELAGDLDAAAAAWRAVENPYEEAVCLLGGNQAQLRRALGLFEQLGAEPAAAMARARLRSLGQHTGLRGLNKATRADPLGLTARERGLLRDLAEGQSNRDIALRWHRSIRTVEHHVSALLSKLELGSRREVAAFVGRQPAHPTLAPSRQVLS